MPRNKNSKTPTQINSNNSLSHLNKKNKDLENLIDTNKKSPYARFWIFTIYEYNEIMPNGKTKLENLYSIVCGEDKTVRYITFQSEICPKTKNKHLQGYIEINKQVRKNGIQTITGCGQHFCAPRKDKDNKRSISYCRKPNKDWPAPEYDCFDKEVNIRYETGENEITQGKRTDWVDLWEMIKSGKTPLEEIKNKYPKLYLIHRKNILEEYRQYNVKLDDDPGIELYEWQKDVFEELKKEVERRRIIWIWSAASETGKNTFSDYIASKMYTYKIPNFKWNDIIHLYTENHKVIWINLPREADDKEGLLISILERLSDGGILTSGKFEGGEKRLKSHIVVTANIEPPNNKIPKRIIEYEIGEEGKLIKKVDHRKTKQE